MTSEIVMNSVTIAWTLGSIFLAGTVYLSVGSNLLRDTSTARQRPFSFSRVQLTWWILIIAYCCLHGYAENFELPALTETCLALLGIGIGTTTVAHVLDDRQRVTSERRGMEVIQDRESEGFLTDILSDDNGVSVHRLQALIFNVIYGVAFVTYFLRNNGNFEEFGVMQYAVLGLSNVGYLGLKALE